jgi:hypothetical protein
MWDDNLTPLSDPPQALCPYWAWVLSESSRFSWRLLGFNHIPINTTICTKLRVGIDSIRFTVSRDELQDAQAP